VRNLAMEALLAVPLVREGTAIGALIEARAAGPQEVAPRCPS
jgi:hypothetical protein